MSYVVLKVLQVREGAAGAVLRVPKVLQVLVLQVLVLQVLVLQVLQVLVLQVLVLQVLVLQVLVPQVPGAEHADGTVLCMRASVPAAPALALSAPHLLHRTFSTGQHRTFSTGQHRTFSTLPHLQHPQHDRERSDNA